MARRGSCSHCAAQVGVAYALLSFLENKDMYLLITRYADLFEQWFDELLPWEDSGLAVSCIYLTGASLFAWHEECFHRVGEEFSEVVEVWSQYAERKEVREVWLKIDLRD